MDRANPKEHYDLFNVGHSDRNDDDVCRLTLQVSAKPGTKGENPLAVRTSHDRQIVREARLVATGSQQTGTASSDCPASAERAPAFRHIRPDSLRHRLERRRQHARYHMGGSRSSNTALGRREQRYGAPIPGVRAAALESVRCRTDSTTAGAEQKVKMHALSANQNGHRERRCSTALFNGLCR